MSLHETFCNKQKPYYKCKQTVKNFQKDLGSTICGDFFIGRHYQISYVESRVPKFLINKYFDLYERNS